MFLQTVHYNVESVAAHSRSPDFKHKDFVDILIQV